MSDHKHDLNNRRLLLAIKQLLVDVRSNVSTIRNRVKQHPDYELDHRPTRFVVVETTVRTTAKRRVLSRRINRLIWLRHKGSVWYACRWCGRILELSFDANGD